MRTNIELTIKGRTLKEIKNRALDEISEFLGRDREGIEDSVDLELYNHGESVYSSAPDGTEQVTATYYTTDVHAKVRGA